MNFVLPKGRIVLSAACLQIGINFGSLEDWLWPSAPWPQNIGIQPANTCKGELSRGFFSFGLVIALGLTSVLAKAKKKQVMELTDVKKKGFLFTHGSIVCLPQCVTSPLPSLPIPAWVDVEAAPEFCRQEMCGCHALSTRLLGGLTQEGQAASSGQRG